MAHRRAMLAIVVGVILLSYAIPASGGSLTVYRLEPSSGWVELPPVNPYATAVRENPLQGWSNVGATSWPLKATAKFEPDTKKAELTVEFVPISRDIRANAGNLFIAPLGRRLEWRLVVTVRNPNDIPMKLVKVRDEFGPAFRATLTGRPAGDARIEGDDPRGMLPLHPTLVWDIGELGPGEAARAEVTVVTWRDGSGNQQFSRPGIYSIDTGARLTYVLAGQTQVRNASSSSVIARKDMDALRSEGPPFDVAAGPIAGEGTGAGSVVPVPLPVVGEGPQVRAVITRVDQGAGTRDITRPGSLFSLVAVGATGNISEITEGGVKKFKVPLLQGAEEAKWEVTLTITNPGDKKWEHWTMTVDFGQSGAAFTVAEKIVAGQGRYIAIPGTPPKYYYGPPEIGALAIGPSGDQQRVSWNWDEDVHGKPKGVDFKKGAEAVVTLIVTASSSSFSGPGEFIFCDDMKLRYTEKKKEDVWVDVVLSPGVYAKVESAPSAQVTLSATRLDWRVRKPGTYAALATEMSFTGTGRLTVDFRGFANLARQDGGSAVINTWYGFGNDLSAVETSGWIPADYLNRDANSRGPITLDPTTPTTLRMWSKINVGDEDSSCEYEDQGVITFIVSNN